MTPSLKSIEELANKQFGLLKELTQYIKARRVYGGVNGWNDTASLNLSSTGEESPGNVTLSDFIFLLWIA